jgi:hypothetical protein
MRICSSYVDTPPIFGKSTPRAVPYDSKMLSELPLHADSLVRDLRAALRTREFRVRPSQVTGKVGASAAGLK